MFAEIFTTHAYYARAKVVREYALYYVVSFPKKVKDEWTKATEFVYKDEVTKMTMYVN